MKVTGRHRRGPTSGLIKNSGTRRHHHKYGTYSIWTGYPNKEDRRRGELFGYNPGHSITIHGGRPLKTEGCIRILDAGRRHGLRNIAELATRFTPDATAITIVNTLGLKYPPPDKGLAPGNDSHQGQGQGAPETPTPTPCVPTSHQAQLPSTDLSARRFPE